MARLRYRMRTRKASFPLTSPPAATYSKPSNATSRRHSCALRQERTLCSTTGSCATSTSTCSEGSGRGPESIGYARPTSASARPRSVWPYVRWSTMLVFGSNTVPTSPTSRLFVFTIDWWPSIHSPTATGAMAGWRPITCLSLSASSASHGEPDSTATRLRCGASIRQLCERQIAEASPAFWSSHAPEPTWMSPGERLSAHVGGTSAAIGYHRNLMGADPSMVGEDKDEMR